MNAEQFESALRQFLHRNPFRAFVVELINGRVLEIDRPKVVFAGGAASYFTPAYELVEFTCEQVREIRHAVREAAS